MNCLSKTELGKRKILYALCFTYHRSIHCDIMRCLRAHIQMRNLVQSGRSERPKFRILDVYPVPLLGYGHRIGQTSAQNAKYKDETCC